MATKKRLTERQRFERWYLRKYGFNEMPTGDRNFHAYWESVAQWVAWQASARAKR